MKKPLINFSVIAALVSIVAKMIYHLFLQDVPNSDMYTRFFYLLCFLFALFIGLRTWKRERNNSLFTDDIKSGMIITSVFAVIISTFTYIYYKFINPGYFLDKINERVQYASENLEGVKLEGVKNTAEFIFSPFIHSTITLFGLMVLGFFYALVLVLIFRSPLGAKSVR